MLCVHCDLCQRNEPECLSQKMCSGWTLVHVVVRFTISVALEIALLVVNLYDPSALITNLVFVLCLWISLVTF